MNSVIIKLTPYYNHILLESHNLSQTLTDIDYHKTYNVMIIISTP